MLLLRVRFSNLYYTIKLQYVAASPILHVTLYFKLQNLGKIKGHAMEKLLCGTVIILLCYFYFITAYEIKRLSCDVP